MRNIIPFLFLLTTALAAVSIKASAQESVHSTDKLILSVRTKFVRQGLELSFEHAVSEVFSLRTAVGFDNTRRGDKSYGNRELIVSLLSNSKTYPYRFSVGPYLKLKDSNYNYYGPDENYMLDAYSSLYFFGAGVSTEYRQRIGWRFMVSPYARFGVNRVIIRNDDGPGTTPFNNNIEADLNMGVAVSFIF
jgi:hypothetical protein